MGRACQIYLLNVPLLSNNLLPWHPWRNYISQVRSLKKTFTDLKLYEFYCYLALMVDWICGNLNALGRIVFKPQIGILSSKLFFCFGCCLCSRLLHELFVASSLGCWLLTNPFPILLGHRSTARLCWPYLLRGPVAANILHRLEFLLSRNLFRGLLWNLIFRL